MTLYELTQEQLYLYNLLMTGEAVDPETGEIDPVVAEQLELTGEELENKIKGVAIIYKQLLSYFGVLGVNYGFLFFVNISRSRTRSRDPRRWDRGWCYT